VRDTLRSVRASPPRTVLTPQRCNAVIGYSFSHFHDEHELALNAWLDRIGRAA
jgi:hypothetical protein